MRNKNKYLKKYKKSTLNILKLRKGPYLCYINHNQKLKTMNTTKITITKQTGRPGQLVYFTIEFNVADFDMVIDEVSKTSIYEMMNSPYWKVI